MQIYNVICTDMAMAFYRQAVKALDNPYGAINKGHLPPYPTH